MEWIYSAAEPKPVETRKHLGMRQRTVNYNIERTAEGDYRHHALTLEPGVWSYDAIVDALVRAEYPHDRMDATVNNYLDDPDDPEARAEMKTMQRWRARAKEIARAAMEYEAGKGGNDV
ncbi:MAG: hypothetical protein K2N25_01160 [Muribaculaceae bacterium]|nr:hypothetical protein [Muribaculaceae bacterium]